MLDKLGQEITIGCKVIVAGGHGELQRMIVEAIEPVRNLGPENIKCRATKEDSYAKVRKLMTKRAKQAIVIDSLIKED